MKTLIPLALFVVSVSGAREVADAPPVAKDPVRDVSFTVGSTYGRLHAYGEELLAAQHPDYAGLIREVAKGSEEALATFFKVSASSPWDAAAGEAHRSTIRKVLLHWGDLGFSKNLAKQPEEVRQRIGWALMTEDDALRLLFPLTYRACTGKAPDAEK